MYRIYCDEEGAQVVTPDYNDAKRQFNKMVREYPDSCVVFDMVTDVNASAQEIAEGDFNGRPVLIACCDGTIG